MPWACIRGIVTHDSYRHVLSLLELSFSYSCGMGGVGNRAPTQDPLTQNRKSPHRVPFATDPPVSVQTEEPAAQEVRPTWQTFAGVHVTPAVQSTQRPASQTLFAPHVLPVLAPFAPVSVQIGLPVPHAICPWSQTLAGVHEAPAVHETQSPFPQTSFVPQLVPLDTSFVVSVQTATPREHDETEPL
jgi:hypothetical protein